MTEFQDDKINASLHEALTIAREKGYSGTIAAIEQAIGAHVRERRSRDA